MENDVERDKDIDKGLDICRREVGVCRMRVSISSGGAAEERFLFREIVLVYVLATAGVPQLYIYRNACTAPRPLGTFLQLYSYHPYLPCHPSPSPHVTDRQREFKDVRCR